jgi:hypothetical protein
MEDSHHFSTGLILGHREDLDKGFLVVVSEPDTATISENREEEGMKKFLP